MTRRKLFIFIIGFVIFYIIYISLLYQNKLKLYWPSNTKVYFSSVKNLVPNNINNNSILMKDKAQGPSQCLIIIRSADGGMGNRMFLFASAYGVARLHQCQLYVAPYILIDLRSIFLVDINKTKVHITTDDTLVVNRTDIYGRYSSCTFYPDLFRVPLNSSFYRYEMIGFYQAYGYFEKYREEISFLFQFNPLAIARNVPLVEQLLKGYYYLFNHSKLFRCDKHNDKIILIFSSLEYSIESWKLYKR
jgi:hypothetical protein